MQWPPWH